MIALDQQICRLFQWNVEFFDIELYFRVLYHNKHSVNYF